MKQMIALNTKQSPNVWNGSEWIPGEGDVLYQGECEDGYHTVWFSTPEKALAAALRHREAVAA